MYKIYNGDCLSIFKDIEDKSVNLVLIDPPYNIGKDKKWDKWKTVNEYVEFMGKVFKECQRVLKDNGSFYFFHNDFLQIVELQNYINNNTDFVFKQLLVWNKRFDKANNKGFLDGFIEVEKLRNYQKMAEYCLYYTFQDETGLNKINRKTNENYQELRKYIKRHLDKKNLKYNSPEIINLFLDSGIYSNYNSARANAQNKLDYYKKSFEPMTEKLYNYLNPLLEWENDYNWFKNVYKEYRQEYEELREEYESLRYTFNNLKIHHSVMDYEIAKKQGHITPKPVDLLEYLIKTSSNEGDIVLDCFMGSGSTGVACMNTNRKFIGIELDNNYFNIAKQRIEEACK